MPRLKVSVDDTVLLDQDVAQPEPVPTPTPTPSTGGGTMDLPTTETQFRDALMTAANEKRVCVLDPRTRIEMTQGITITQTGNTGMPWGVNGNGAKLIWKGSTSADMLTFKGTNGAVNRSLIVEKLGMDGNGYAGVPAGACLKLYAPDGDPGAIYKFKVKDVYTMYATRGFVIEGAVFEGFLDNIHAENHRSHGMECLHTNVNNVRGIVSNINIIHPNLSRNMGAGLKCTYSTNLMFGSFVLNALGAVVAPEGLRYAAGNNGENTGEAMFNVPWQGYGTVIVGNELSGDASTHARQWVNGAWVDVGKPSLYLIAGDAAIIQRDNHVSYYGAGTNPMKVVKGAAGSRPSSEPRDVRSDERAGTLPARREIREWYEQRVD